MITETAGRTLFGWRAGSVRADLQVIGQTPE
jgi:hypothetical protein